MFDPDNNYNDYTETVHWANMRDKARRRFGNVCENCGVSGKKYILECHHLSYSNKWNEKPEDLIMLCVNCHHLVHTQLIHPSRRFGHYSQRIKENISRRQKIQEKCNYDLIRGVEYLDNGLYKPALNALKQAVKSEPENLQAHGLIKDLCIRLDLKELLEEEEQIISELIEKRNLIKKAVRRKKIIKFSIFVLLFLLLAALLIVINISAP